MSSTSCLKTIPYGYYEIIIAETNSSQSVCVYKQYLILYNLIKKTYGKS